MGASYFFNLHLRKVAGQSFVQLSISGLLPSASDSQPRQAVRFSKHRSTSNCLRIYSLDYVGDLT